MKSQRTIAVSIPKEVKLAVAERDSYDDCPCCVICGRPGRPEAHYIPRSRGGLGIEENIVTLCPQHHDQYDHTFRRDELGDQIRAYLMEKYPDWNEDDLVFRKYED